MTRRLDAEARKLVKSQAGVPHRVLSALHTMGSPGLVRLSSGDPSFPQPCAICSATENIGLSSRTQDWRCGAHIFDDA